MPITRTAMVDDDGSGTTGTILNNAWKQELYNQIDLLAGGDQVMDDVTCTSLIVNTTARLTGNVGIGQAPGAERLSITGNTIGTGWGYFNGSIGSGAEITAATFFKEAGRTVAQGYLANEPFNAANHTASTGNWTLTAPDQAGFAYALVGKLAFIHFHFIATTVSAATLELRLRMPGGLQVGSVPATGHLDYQDAGAAVAHGGLIIAFPTETMIRLYKLAYANWAIATNNTVVRGSLVVPIV